MRSNVVGASRRRAMETVSLATLISASCVVFSPSAAAQQVTGTSGCVVQPSSSTSTPGTGQVSAYNTQTTVPGGVVVNGAQVSNCANPVNFTNATEVNTAVNAVNATATAAQTTATTAQSAASAAQTTANNAVQYMLFNNTPVAQVDLSKNAALPAGTKAVALTGLSSAQLNATSSDAVNGAQLYTTNQTVAGLQTQINNTAGNLVYNSAGTPTGAAPSAKGLGSVAAGGGGTVASGQYSTALGYNAQATTQSAVAIGQNASASGGNGAVSIGAGNKANGAGAVAIGDPNVVTGTGAVGLGANNTVNGQGAIGIGNLNQATGQSAVALGDSAIANGASAVALGQSANAGVPNAVAIGNGASSTGLNSAAIGAGSTDGGQANVVGIGNAAQTRKLAYLSAGNLTAASTDAVNGAQLYALGTSTASALGGGATYNTTTGQLNQPTYTVGNVAYHDMGSALQGATQYVQVNGANPGTAANANAAGSIAIGQNAGAGANNSVAIGTGAYTTGNNSVAIGAGSTDGGRANVLSVGSAQQQRGITNVAAGNVTANSTDAINGGQLYSTNQAVASLQSQYGTLRRDAFAGVAGAMAMQGGQPIAPGHFSLGGGVGYYGGQAAVALRAGYTTPDGHWNLGGAVSSGVNSTRDIGGAAHADYLF